MRFFTTLFIVLCGLCAHLAAQTSHLVQTTNSFTFNPTQLVIEVGDTVVWRNTNGGFHNVNGSLATYPGNPQGFANGAAASGQWTFSHVFTLPGTYTYQCDPHANLNMFGFITVNDNSSNGPADVVISEINYNPPGDTDTQYEFIELFNNGNNAVNLLNYTFSAGITYTFTTGYNLGAGEYLVLAVDSVSFQNAYGVPALQFAGGLNNGGELLQLLDADGNTVDSVEFDDSFGWPVDADGAGASLVRCDANADGNDPANWAAANTASGVDIAAVPTFCNPGSASQCVEGPIVGFVASSFTVDETMSVIIQVALRNGPTTQPLTVSLEGSGGTATLGADYNFEPASITFPTGADNDTMQILISVVDDAEAEGLEQAIIRLVDPTTGLTVDGTKGTFTLNIEDNDTQIADIVITEIMYNPPGTDTQYEYLELYNNDVLPVHMHGYYFSMGIVDTLEDVMLMPGDYLLLAVDSVSLEAAFGVAAFQWQSGALNNGGETLELRDAAGNVVDVVTYSNAAPWPTEANGSGPALVLCDPDQDNETADNWIAGVQRSDVFIGGVEVLGSPGEANDCEPSGPVTYPSYPIGVLTTNNADGVADSTGVRAEVRGIVYGVNLRPAGLQFTIIDANRDGIATFSSANNFGYTVQEGDDVTLRGVVSQFNGLTQINLDTVIRHSGANALFTPRALTAALGEEDESDLVQVVAEIVTITPVTGAINVDMLDDMGNPFVMRIDLDSDMTEGFINSLQGNLLRVTGLGGQFDNSSPFTEGYQLFPRYERDIEIITSTEEPEWASSLRLFPVPFQQTLNVNSATQLDRIVVRNSLGQLVDDASITGYSYELQTAGWPSGVYFVTLHSGQQHVLRKVVK